MSLKDSLSQIKDKNNSTNLYNHLQNVLTKILLDNPKNAFELFEDYSIQVRSSGYDFSRHSDFDNSKRINTNFEAIQENLDKTSKLIGKINVGTAEEPQEPGPCGYVPNLMEESKWFEWAGQGLGAEETFKILKSLTLLSVQKQVKNVRLWGKILGSQRDYYVAEGQADTGVEDGEQPWNVEPRGTGVNRLNYWVTNDLLTNEWIELPLILPQHIEISRRIKYIFTGNLENNVITNPFFFGKEKHLLKCQIVRISHSTGILPKGQFTVREGEEREIDPTEEYKMPNFHQQSKLENWVHAHPSILKCGRLTLLLPPDLDPEKDAEKEMKTLEQNDPYEPRIKVITHDIASQSTIKQAWKIRLLGDCTDYNPMAKDQSQKVNYGVIVIKSLVWPGASTVYHNKQMQSLYIGYGFKQTSQQFYPKEPQPIQTEPIDKDEQQDPNYPAEVQESKQQDDQDN